MKIMEELRNKMKVSGIPFWKYAEKIGISEMTLYRWLRKYNEEHYKLISDAIDKVKGGEVDE